MKRIVQHLILIAAALVIGAGTSAAETGPKPEKIRFAYQTAHTLFVVANELGWFQEEFAKDGIVFEAEKFVAGPPIIEAFAGNRIDFGLTGDQPALLARANNIDIKAVGVPVSGPKGLALVVPNGSKIASVKQLKGKKVGVTVGSVGHHLLQILLKRNGLKPGDIQQVNLTPPDIKTALAAGNLDAAVTWDPFISIIEEERIGRRLVDATGLKNNANVILVTGSFARTNPELVKRVLKVFIRAEKYVKANPEKAVTVVSRATGYKREVVARYIDNFDYNIRLSNEVVRSIEETAVFLRESNILRREVKVSELVDTSYLRAIGVR